MTSSRRQATSPNELWQADHTELDILVLNEQGKPARPWLSVIIDDYSRAVAGYFLSLQAPSALQTALALRQAIWRKAEPLWQVCGIPDTTHRLLPTATGNPCPGMRNSHLPNWTRH